MRGPIGPPDVVSGGLTMFILVFDTRYNAAESTSLNLQSTIVPIDDSTWNYQFRSNPPRFTALPLKFDSLFGSNISKGDSRNIILKDV